VGRSWRTSELRNVTQVAAVTFTVKRDGSVSHVHITEASGNTTLDFFGAAPRFRRLAFSRAAAPVSAQRCGSGTAIQPKVRKTMNRLVWIALASTARR